MYVSRIVANVGVIVFHLLVCTSILAFVLDNVSFYAFFLFFYSILLCLGDNTKESEWIVQRNESKNLDETRVCEVSLGLTQVCAGMRE